MNGGPEKIQEVQQSQPGMLGKAVLWIKRNHLPYTLCAAVLLISFALFLREPTVPEFNRAAGWGALAIIALVMLIGPLSRLYPKLFMKYLYVRKPAGIIGALLALVHCAYSVQEFYGGDLVALASYATIRIAVVFCLISSIILIIMTLTSTQAAVKAMGYGKWKVLQTFGYLALIAAAAHAFFLNYQAGFADTRPIEWAIMSFAVLVVAARIYDYVKAQQKKKVGPTQNP